LGANCTVICGVTIGEYAFVGAGAVVNRDVPRYALMVGVPAKRAGWMSESGTRLVGIGLVADETGATYEITENSCRRL
jgi:UDP-2-acetamido-3-amino-2,3-dideoxy-glucuronate N-acetyltransferase